jgi:octaprenyl-diphosphate synthase
MILDQDLVPNDIPKYLPKMKSMYEDLFSGGKGYRGALVASISNELGLKTEDASLLSRSIEYIHNSSLLHDDFVDGSELRRGKTAAWKKYSGGYAILGGDYLLAKVIKNLSECGSLQLISYTSQSILDLVEGEWLQDACQNRIDVTKAEMERVHSLKTSALFAWCFKAPAMLVSSISKNQMEKLSAIGSDLGSLLQRSDDLLDYNIRNFEKKDFFRDLPSGYFNLFTVHLLKDKNEKIKKQAFEFKDLDLFLKALDLDLNNTLESFDKESELILSRVKQNISSFSLFSEDFKKSLLEAAHTIYWRKSF